MSLPISSVVDVSISITPNAPPKIGFGIAAIVSSEPTISGSPVERVVYYNSLSELGDVYLLATEVYKAAQAYFGQSPSPRTFGVITQASASGGTAVLTGASGVSSNVNDWLAVDGGQFGLDINGTYHDVAYIGFGGSTTMDEIASDIESSINAAGFDNGGEDAWTLATVIWDSVNARFIITAGVTNSTITFTTVGLAIDSPSISRMMLTEADQGGFLTQGVGVSESIVDALNAAEQFDQGWYGVLLVSGTRDTQDAEDVALWTEGRVKVLSLTTHNPNTLINGDVDNLAYRINAAGYTRTIVNYSSLATQYPDAAVLGKAFTVDFNTVNSVITLKFKPLATITAERFTSSQKLALDSKRANAFIVVGGADMYAEGYMAAQLFFDERHGVDWLTGELEFNVFSYLLSRATKVPQTDAGTTSLVQQVTRTLDLARRNGLIAPGSTADGEFLQNGYKITYGKVSDMPPSDKASRMSPTLFFTALLAGAVHFVQINGVLER